MLPGEPFPRDFESRLAALPAERLAAVLAQHVDSLPALADDVRRLLRPTDPATLVTGYLADIEDLRRRLRDVPRRERPDNVGNLRALLDSIGRDLVPQDPRRAAVVLVGLLGLANVAIESTHDDGFAMSQVFADACRTLAQVSATAGQPPEVERAFDALVFDDDFGVLDALLDLAPDLLGPEGRARTLRRRWASSSGTGPRDPARIAELVDRLSRAMARVGGAPG